MHLIFMRKFRWCQKTTQRTEKEYSNKSGIFKTGKLLIKMMALCLFLIAFLAIFVFFIFKKNDLHILRGEITDTFYDFRYSDGSFLLETESGLYMDSLVTLDSINEKFHSNVQIGDLVYVVCKIDPHEISPQCIDIYYIF